MNEIRFYVYTGWVAEGETVTLKIERDKETVANAIEDVVEAYNTMMDAIDEAVDIADKYTKKGSICLLSPAASSYNKFKNFEEKGNYYKQTIKKKYS